MPKKLKLSAHASQRRKERDVPQFVQDGIIRRSGYRIASDGTAYHIIRYSDGEWGVGVEQEGVLTTFLIWDDSGSGVEGRVRAVITGASPTLCKRVKRLPVGSHQRIVGTPVGTPYYKNLETMSE